MTDEATVEIEFFACCDAAGKVLWTGKGAPGAAAIKTPAEGETIEVVDPEVCHGWQKQGDTFVALLPAVRTLEQRRLARWAEAQQFRAFMVAGGCLTPLGRVQTDEVSQASILQAMIRAQMALSTGEPWSITWRMEDNSLAVHDAGQMIAMALAVGNFKTACFDASFATASAIADSDDPESIDITTGYPSPTEE